MRTGRKQIEFVKAYCHRLFAGAVHKKRIDSLANAVVGVMCGERLSSGGMGEALAEASGILEKSATKQVDRLLGNHLFDPWAMSAVWITERIGLRKKIVVSMDWTEFDYDDQCTLALNLVTRHGRATPLLTWSTIKSELKNKRNDIEDACLTKLRELVPDHVKVTILADRGFGDVKLFSFLEELGFSYVIRFRGNTYVTNKHGKTKLASEWLGKSGKAIKLDHAKLTLGQWGVNSIVCVKDKDMKDEWHLATSEVSYSARRIIRLYSRRWSIEPSFRDSKDIRFGLGLSTTRVSCPDRRDRLLMITAIAVLLLTLIGAAGESLGMDRQIRTSTTTRRVHSLFLQGRKYLKHMRSMRDERLQPLLLKFRELLCCASSCTATFWFV
jgi:hypothetical protein